MKRFKLSILAAALAGTTAAHAALLTAPSGDMTDVLTFDQFISAPVFGFLSSPVLSAGGLNTVLLGSALGSASEPQTLVPPSTVVPLYDFGLNGIWTATLGLPGGPDGAVVSSSANVAFTFAAPVASVGAFFNIRDLDNGPTPSITITAMGENSRIIESHTVSFGTRLGEFETDAGQFWGVSTGTAQIVAFEVTADAFGNFFALDNLQFSQPVPEPGEWALMLAGLGLLGAVARRRAARR